MLSPHTHLDALSTIPEDAELWFDDPDDERSRRISFADFKLLMNQINTAPAYSPLIFAGLPQALSGAGACSVVLKDTNFTSTGAGDALTLANGTIIGQLKQVTHIVDGGSGVLTPAEFADGTEITFTTGGERWVGLWTGTAWQTIEISNVADGGAVLPAIS